MGAAITFSCFHVKRESRSFTRKYLLIDTKMKTDLLKNHRLSPVQYKYLLSSENMEDSQVAEQLEELLDSDPQKAIEKARTLTGDVSAEHLKSGTLIDAGSAIQDATVILEGIQVCRSLLSRHPEMISAQYNLANGLWLYAHAVFKEGSGPDWFETTRSLRREARFLFNQVAVVTNAPKELRTQAYTNQGNVLKASFRWVEAYDTYVKALNIENHNGVAAANIVTIIQDSLDYGIGESETLRTIASQYARLADESQELIKKFAGIQTQKIIEGRMPLYITKETNKITGQLPAYQQFIARNRLALSPTIEGADLSLPRWDSLMIDSLHEKVPRKTGLPPLFAMFNCMKADYLAARWMAFRATCGKLPESGRFADMLDYSQYGVQESLMIFAQRSALDVLDKIAVATADYLAIQKAKKVNFKGVWYKPTNRGQQQNGLEWKDEIRQEIEHGNIAIIALSEIAEDLIDEHGYLKRKNVVRNASTHRFTVLHDIEMCNYREHTCIEHCSIEEFEDILIETLQLTRAALFYFVEMVNRREMRIQQGKNFLSLRVLDHHGIRLGR